MLPAPCCSPRIIRNPSEIDTSVLVRGMISPVKGEVPQTTCHEKKKNSHTVKGEMPQTSCHEKNNSRPKDYRVLDAKPTRAVWPPNHFLEERISMEVALTAVQTLLAGFLLSPAFLPAPKIVSKSREDVCECVDPCSPACESTRLGAWVCLAQVVWFSWCAQEFIASPAAKWPCQDGCEGLSAACAMHQLEMGSQGSRQPEECFIWNGMLRPGHRLMLVSFKIQMLLAEVQAQQGKPLWAVEMLRRQDVKTALDLPRAACSPARPCPSCPRPRRSRSRGEPCPGSAWLEN